MAGRPLLIVEDDAALRATLAEQLAQDGEFEPAAAGSVAAAEAMLGAAEDGFDAILLDVGLPDGDGREFCARLRRQGLRVPILLLTGRDAEQDVIRGLDAGANDYVQKPFRRAELLARVRAQLRGFDETEHAAFAIGPYSFRPAQRLLQDRGRSRKIPLTDKECRILRRLLQAKGQAVSRRALLDEVWGYSSSVTTHTLETHVYRLRQKMEPNPAQLRFLLTEPGGYRLETRAPAAVG
ncbi:response regulator transcription factor [Paracraurococcus ruber]|uniref:response regulator transcription factor n=1 Tax=Paracraurococcus ruber TaxID=77675 RepID=UPI001057F5E9|nr:response regulator transcription factor [Paracraurococcus ruber]TDG04202.1 response regulator transcription factor [Paracraurococcus ruber]